MAQLNDIRVAFVATDGVEQIELQRPWQAAQEAGANPVLVAPKAGTIQGFNHRDRGDVFDVDTPIADADPEQFQALVLPGGVVNPDRLRIEPAVVEFIGSMVELGKPVAVICHGPWTLIEADVVEGRRMTSWPSLMTDLKNAGADWVDQEVVVCQAQPSVFVSSRKPDDLDAFCAAMVEQFATVPTH